MDKANRYLHFVLHRYRHGAFDTRKALDRYRASHPQQQGWLRRHIAPLSAAAVAILILMAGIFYLTRSSLSETRLYSDDRSVSYLLPDSSVVTLYPHSSLVYDPARFGRESRQVEMTGKVRFKVTRNPKSPFIARADRATVRVLGTQFIVDGTVPDSIAVSVSSGKVLFTSDGMTDGVILTAGMDACLLADATVPSISTASTEPDVKAAPHIVYDNTPLDDVLKDLSSRFNVTLTCSASDKRLTAEFDTDDLGTIIMMIEKSLDVEIRKEAAR